MGIDRPSVYILIVGIALSWVFPEAHSTRRSHLDRSRSSKSLKCECGMVNRRTIGRIVNGKPAYVNEFPWMVAIRDQLFTYCGGSIINNRYVLTAGHCIYEKQLEDINVLLGAHDIRAPNERTVVVKIAEKLIHHEKFFSSQLHAYQDVALIKVKGTIEFNKNIRPICLPPIDKIGIIANTLEGAQEVMDKTGKLKWLLSCFKTTSCLTQQTFVASVCAWTFREGQARCPCPSSRRPWICVLFSLPEAQWGGEEFRQHADPFREIRRVGPRVQLSHEPFWFLVLAWRYPDFEPGGRSATVAGWGLTSFKGSRSTSLLKLNVKTVSWEDCIRDYLYTENVLKRDTFCAVGKRNGSDSCSGDSGGPLMAYVPGSKTKMQIIGIVSWGIGCAKAAYPGVYVNTAHYINWILGKISDGAFCRS